jgi:hypothetical protein
MSQTPTSAEEVALMRAELLRMAEVVAERDKLRALALSLAERIAAQAELLSRRAEKPKGVES